MKQSHFFAHLARMKLIQRWPLMRSVSSENISEHSLQVAFVAHALALIKNKKFDGKLNPEHIALIGMYHDTSEVLTGDLPTPVKYYNPDIAQEYKKIEAAAEQRLLSMLPEEFQDDFAPFLISGTASKEEQNIVKQADTICAYLKCLEELSAGNHEYEQAKRRLEETLEQRKSPEMDYFLTTFAPSFELSLDEIS
ncbi:5'-deoxynucleotidase [Vibrio gigantis]|uniref:5'-deoxynucleotidase n=2 Tax=Vibrio TaxID=662 RepID=A0A2S7VJ77_9VIBR|nr:MULTISPECIES: 5'-deoxynucleotidase [Vibrio]MDE9382421.1 5'-deoxynucleotidase [Vibrio alginolyticus]EGU42579.1 5'-nucleotidase [Vibrio splendidus ATCC 33789]KAA8668332.1 5'-deoxynucleotidase [Vibrio gigantis]MCG9555201.1 5'-deoxynucleotidase [Vibrio sp. Isolate32]MCG9600393.1 5'-deoxynucleotidase [Vibrio sp. Isolate31]|tara:strand:- start:4695 stop:5279 length:585 start_codon:yes stop_codon:yes gene_type:complete